MAERRDGGFSPLPERRLFTRLKIELGELKGTLARPAAGPSMEAAEAAPREGFARRLKESAQDFARELRERPKETLTGLVLPAPESPFRRRENAPVIAASVLVHLAVLGVLLYSGALHPLFRVRETNERRDYEVTMLKLPPAPWLAPPPDQFPADMSATDAFGNQPPSVVPAAPPPPPVVVQRPLRTRNAPSPSLGAGTLDPPTATEATDALPTPADSTEASATPAPSPRVTPQSSPRRPGATPATANASTANASATPRAGATPGVPPDAATAEFERRLREVVARSYARHLAAAGQPTAPDNFSAEVEFKISAEGLLSDFKPTTLSGSPFIDGGLQEALNVLGERRTFQSLAKLSQVNAVRLDVDATTAQLTVRCQAATKELADAMTPVLTAVVRDLLDSLGVTDLTAPDERLSVTADGQNVTAVLSMPRQQAAELMRARFAEPPPAPTQQP